ncbi:MAG: hypothetical protein JXR70_15335 [Spirochaetales bacterium]|nr:hypothetical protein [Spirochaetales bacterium]
MKNLNVMENSASKKIQALGDKRLNLLLTDPNLKMQKERLSKYSGVKSVNLADNEEQLRKFLRKEGEFNQAPSPDVIIFDIQPIIKTGITS